MPRKLAAGAGFLELCRCDVQLAAEKVTVRSGPQVDPAFLEVGVLVFAGPNPHASDHLAILRFAIDGLGERVPRHLRLYVDDRSMGLIN